jgi:hypothetical protein
MIFLCGELSRLLTLQHTPRKACAITIRVCQALSNTSDT